MTNPQDVAVTYKGPDTPFKDRIYRSGLTFTPGQTRVLPEPLAMRFLRHEDVFERAQVKMETTKQEKLQVQLPQPLAQENAGKQDTPVQVPVDDTQAQLDAAKKEDDDKREQDGARFELLESIEAMDRKALISWAEINYQQKIPGNSSLDKARDMARGFIDQYGMPV